MPVYVAEIAGRGIAAFDAANDAEAEARLAETAFRRDLIVLQNQGRSLWDGVSQIHVRQASADEAVSWQAGKTADDRFVFLVPVVDPSDDRFDDDDDDDHDHQD